MTSSSGPTASFPSEAQTIHAEEIIAEINTEMEAAARASSFGGGMTGLGPAPLRMISLGGTVVDTSVPPPPANIDPIPPTLPSRSILIHLSLEEEVNIMPSAGDQLPKGKGSKRKLSGASNVSTSKKKPRKKEE